MYFLKDRFVHYSRHGLVNGLYPVAHRELVDDLLCRLLEVHLPCLVPLRVRQLHRPARLLAQVVEQVLQVNRA